MITRMFGLNALAAIGKIIKGSQKMSVEELEGLKAHAKIVVLGCPDHVNLGDQAITFAERCYLKNKSSRPFITICGGVKERFGELRKYINPEDLICLHGGGNMGTLYEDEEYDRLLIINEFKNNRIISFPQTISYEDGAHGRRFLSYVQAVYSSHPDLHLFARERMSYERMKNWFPNANVYLTPDIVLSLKGEDGSAATRSGVLLCMRNDKERLLSDDDVERISEALDGRASIVWTDTALRHHEGRLLSDEGTFEVKKKIRELSAAQLVVTDRIHGMIFCALAGTPCIALNNTNGKVGQEYRWLSDLPYIRFADSTEGAISMLQEPFPEPGRFPSEKYDELFEPLARLLE